jgi:hypothetical protein
MLTIRKEQMRVLGSVALRSFEMALVRHFFEFFQDECRLLGTHQVRRVVQLGMSRAMPLGYKTNREIGLYINLMFMLGSDFENDPQIPWARDQIRDQGVFRPYDRIRRVFQSALDYLGETSGDNNGNLVRALIRIRDYNLAAAPTSSGQQLEDDLFELFGKLHPQKQGVQGEQPTRALIRLAGERVKEYGPTSNPALAVYSVLMFMLGAGFDKDPLYPWASEVLNLTDDRREPARVPSLHYAAMEHLRESLTHKPGNAP